MQQVYELLEKGHRRLFILDLILTSVNLLESVRLESFPKKIGLKKK